MDQTPTPEIDYVFSISQKTGNEQQVTINGNVKAGETPKEVFLKMEVITRMLDALMHRNNFFVMESMLETDRQQLREIDEDLNSDIVPAGRGSGAHRDQLRKNRQSLVAKIAGEEAFLASRRKELSEWGAELPEDGTSVAV